VMLVCAVAVPLAFWANTSMSVDLTPEEQLGKSLFEDVNISYNEMQSCKSCHNGAGFADQTEAYRLFTQAIAAYECSPDVMKFSSLFDQGKLTRDQMKGHGLFQKYCSSCHPMANNTGYGSLFTTFG